MEQMQMLEEAHWPSAMSKATLLGFLGGDASKRKSGKSERIKSLQRVSVGTGVKTEFYHQGYPPWTSNTSLKLIRKSLLVLKVNPEEASIPKVDVMHYGIQLRLRLARK
ncbi:uncharacterized protein [Malus domestica]|uniref:uncharacterized protein isoform X5 n=1 Tax=Malus domestica TaxID=3750 RepID=UPI0039755E27